MGKRSSLSSEEIAKIDAYHDQGLSNRAIARKLSRSPKVVNNYLKNPSEYGKRFKGNTYKKVSARDKRKILQIASNSSMSLSKIGDAAGVQVSKTTIYNIIKSSEHLKRRKLQKKPPLKDVHKQQRLKFGKDHMSWIVQQGHQANDWKRVIFSDEKRFNIDGPDGYNYYFHDIRKEEKFLSRHHSREGGVMVWGAITYYGASSLVFVDERMTGDGYKNLLQNAFLEFKDIFGPLPFIFQHDNAPIHTARVVKSWLQEQEVEILPWPPYSPDLNIIENVWGWLTRKVYEGGRQFSTKEELKDAIKLAWSEISLNYLKSLYDSMQTRIFDIISAKGGYTKY